MKSDINVISQRAFLKWSASLQKLKRKLFFKLDAYCLSRQKAMAFKVMRYFFFTIQFRFVEFSSFKHEVFIAVSYKTQNKN